MFLYDEKAMVWRGAKIMKMEIKNLSKHYGALCALDGLNIALENGIYGLLGPNGAGKSTLIHLLTDNVRREQGSILCDGKDILDMGGEYRKLLGFMPQQQGFYEEFSAGAFLMYMAQLKGLKKREAKERVGYLLEVVNLSDVRHEKIGSFSGGMKQRVLLAQALLNDPKILILDEPTAGVDPKERISIRNFISGIAKDKIVLLATHIVSDVEAVAKEILLLKKGKIIGQGTPYELLEQVKGNVYEIVATDKELDKIQRNYKISNLYHTNKELRIKIVSDKPPEEYIYEKVEANLEDVYLYYFEDLEKKEN